MKLVVDGPACISSGMCVTLAPELFTLPGPSDPVVARDPLTDEEQVHAEDAVACCPVEALLLKEE